MQGVKRLAMHQRMVCNKSSGRPWAQTQMMLTSIA